MNKKLNIGDIIFKKIPNRFYVIKDINPYNGTYCACYIENYNGLYYTVHYQYIDDFMISKIERNMLNKSSMLYILSELCIKRPYLFLPRYITDTERKQLEIDVFSKT